MSSRPGDRTTAAGIDPGRKRLFIDTGEALEYDIASFNLGSHVPANIIPGAARESLPVKPIVNLETLRYSILTMTATSIPRILHNILARIRGESLKEFSPQKRYLQILNLGDDDGILVYYPLVLKGRWAFRLKNFIDKRFISQFRH